MTKRGKRPTVARQLSFVHFRTWRPVAGERMRAVAACMETPNGRIEFVRTTPYRGNVTCGACIEALKEAGLWQS